MPLKSIRDRVDDFFASLASAIEAPASGGAADWLVNRIRRWGATPARRAAAADLTPDEQILVFSGLGRRVFDTDVGSYRTRLQSSTRSVDVFGGASARREALREHCAFLFVSLLDPLILSDDQARTAAFQQVELRGHERAEIELADGGGAILLGCLQTHTGFGFRHPALAHWRVAMVRHMSAMTGDAARWAEQSYGQTVRFVPTTPEGAARLLDCLKGGGCVAVQNDFIYPETVGMRGSLLGRHALVSRSLVKLILRTRAAVLPVSVVRLQPFESRKIRVEIHPRVPFEDLTQSRSDQDRAAQRLSLVTECLIRRYPVQWTHWTLLERRWKEAEAALRKAARRARSAGTQ
jgi:lauroyl/myristoyl acyltransferase